VRFPSLLAIVVIAAACSNADNTPAKAGAPAASAPVASVVNAKPTKVDFAIPLTVYKPKDINFEMYRNRWSLLFYFLPTCGHCQHTYPWIQKLRTSYEKKGLAFAAIASGTATAEDLQMFDTDFKLDMPTFQDGTRKFGELYGTGSVPLILVVKPDGSFQSWVGSDDSTRVAIEAVIKAGLHIK